MKVQIIDRPYEWDWIEVKRRALVTMGKEPIMPPNLKWKKAILRARHSPIRRLWFSFYIECPYYVSVHLARHVHAQPYIQTQRNDRQKDYDRTKAPQDTTVKMIWDINAEELMVIANKRLCSKVDPVTREIVEQICNLVLRCSPEFEGLLVSACEYNGRCHEMQPCGKLAPRGPLQHDNIIP